MHKECSMKGFLEFSVLGMINKRNLSGHEIREEICRRKGCMPSPGTIYPVLKGLQNKGLIKEINYNAKEKRYTITKNGKREVTAKKKMFLVLFKDVFS